MPTPFDAVHIRLSRMDLEDLSSGAVLVMTPGDNRDISVVVDAAAAPNTGSQSASKSVGDSE